MNMPPLLWKTVYHSHSSCYAHAKHQRQIEIKEHRKTGRRKRRKQGKKEEKRLVHMARFVNAIVVRRKMTLIGL